MANQRKKVHSFYCKAEKVTVQQLIGTIFIAYNIFAALYSNDDKFHRNRSNRFLIKRKQEVLERPPFRLKMVGGN